MSDHVFARIRERSPESSHARWLAIVRVISRHGVLGAIREKVGSGDFRVAAASGQLVIDRRGRPVTFTVGGSQPGCPTISLEMAEALYQHAGLWQRPVPTLDWPAVAKWFVHFERFHPELLGARGGEVAQGCRSIRGWTDTTLAELVREGRINCREGYYYLSERSWSAIMALLAGLTTTAVVVVAHFIP